MNQRIKQLAEQASLYAISQLTHEKSIRWQEVFEQKFAELIVQECAELVDGRTFLYAGNTIREHFGVEE